MKRIIWTLLILGIIACENQKEQDPEKEAILLDSMEQKGFDIFKENPHAALPIFKEVAKSFEANDQLQRAGTTYLNIASIYAEYTEHKDSALLFANKSLIIWKKTEDAPQEANLLKYVGYLKGELGETKDAERDIEVAMKIYRQLGDQQGLAVSEFNLARIYFNAQELKTSDFHFRKATDYWRKRKTWSRVFTNNVFGIKLYRKLGSPHQVDSLIAECERIKADELLDDYIKGEYEKVLKE